MFGFKKPYFWLLVTVIVLAGFIWGSADRLSFVISAQSSPSADHQSASPRYTPEVQAPSDVPKAKTETAKTQQMNLQSWHDVEVWADQIDFRKSFADRMPQFKSFQRFLLSHSELIPEVKGMIQDLEPGSEDYSNRVSFWIGLLASISGEHSEITLVEILNSAADDDVGTQAAAALGDIPNPSADAVNALVLKVENDLESPTGSASILAIGSIGYKLKEISHGSGISDRLLTMAARAETRRESQVIMSAMGNHGSSKYFDVITGYLQDDDPSVRAKALFCLRRIQHPRALSTIGEAASLDSHSRVKISALKSLQFREPSATMVQAILKIARSSSDPEVLSLSVSSLYRLGNDLPNEARQALRALSADDDSTDSQVNTNGHFESD
jgi:hypothetical protein